MVNGNGQNEDGDEGGGQGVGEMNIQSEVVLNMETENEICLNLFEFFLERINRGSRNDRNRGLIPLTEKADPITFEHL